MENTNINFSLALDIKSIPLDKYEKDFTFIVNEKRYKTSRFVADLLSPIISKYHFQDETLDEFTIKIDKHDKKSSKKRDYFQDFLELYKYNGIEIDPNARKHYCEYFLQLGNFNEYLKLQQEYFEGLDSSNVIDRFNELTNNLDSSNENEDKEEKENKKDNTLLNNLINTDAINGLTNYISSNFDDIDKEKLKTLDKSIIEKIIKSDSLILEEEDSLLNFIIDLYKKDQIYSDLFEYVYFANVKEETLEEFVNCFSLDYINSGIWMKIFQRLIHSKQNQIPVNRYFEKVTELSHVCGQEFEGILNYLTQKSGGNIHENGTVEISTNSYNSTNHPKNLVNFQKNDYYQASNSLANVLFDFKDKKIQLNAYSIKSKDSSQNNYHLKYWVIEASNDQNQWDKIDERSNNSNLNGSSIVDTFNIKKNENYYRFIRLRETSSNWNGGYNTYFCCLEFYGKLKEVINQKK